MLRSSPARLAMMALAFLMSSATITMSMTTPQSGSSRLMVHIPQSLSRRPYGYTHQTAMFGMRSLQEGKSLVESLYYVDADLCSSSKNTNTAVSFGMPRLYPNRTATGNSGAPFLLLVRRGGCSFVKKVRHAQLLGAAGVILADNVCLCDDANCKAHDPHFQANSSIPYTCQHSEPVLADDGSASDVTIPSFLVDKPTGDLFIEYLTQEARPSDDSNHTAAVPPMRVEMTYSTTPSSNNNDNDDNDNDNNKRDPNHQDLPQVFYDLWMQPTWPPQPETVLEFWSGLQAVGRVFPQATFTPHMAIYDGVAAGCHDVPHVFDYDDDSEMPCYNLCTNQGRYCSADPDGDLHRGLSGSDVVHESLRRLCIWSIYGETQQQPHHHNKLIGMHKKQTFFDYASEFQRQCYTNEHPQLFRDPDCIDQVYDMVGIDGSKVHQCMRDSGGVKANRVNPKLEAELAALKHQGIYVVPSMQVLTAPRAEKKDPEDDENNNDDASKQQPSPNDWTPNTATSYQTLQGTAVTPQGLFEALCRSLGDQVAPDICQTCLAPSCAHTMACVRSGGITCQLANERNSVLGGISVRTFVSSILLLVLVAAGFLAWMQEFRRRTLKRQVHALLEDYSQLPDNGLASSVVPMSPTVGLSVDADV